MDKSLIIIIPVFNEEEAIQINIETIQKVLDNDQIKADILLVDDGSKDGTWKVISSMASSHTNISGIRFARNFGKELALTAAIDAVDADLYLFMDSDLQHPPKEIKGMLQLMESSNADIVEGIKTSRGKESLKYRLIAKNFYRILKATTQLDMDNSSDFKLMNSKVVEAIRRFKESSVFFRGLVDWVGFKKVEYGFKVEERKGGKSSFSSLKLMKLATNAILSYTSKPLLITVFLGLIFLGFSIILGIQTLYNYLSGYSVDGFSTVILLILITGSMILLSMGIIGIYIARIYDEVKSRPRYLLQDSIGKTKFDKMTSMNLQDKGHYGKTIE